MGKGLRNLAILFLFILIASFSVDVASIGAAETIKKPEVKKNKAAAKKKAAVKKETSSKKEAAVKAAAPENAGKDSTKTAIAKKQAAPEKSNGEIYDLGNITVVGEDKTKIKDATRKKAVYSTAAAPSEKTVKKDVAGFIASDVPARVNDDVTNTMKTYFETMSGNHSETSTKGVVTFERNAPRDKFNSKSEVAIEGGKSDGYRHKSDYRNLVLNAGYKNEEGDGSSTDVAAYGQDETRSLPGFNNFENNYTDTETGGFNARGVYKTDTGKFEAGLGKTMKKIKIPVAAVDEKYDATVFNVGFSTDYTVENNPLTLELKLSSDSLDTINSGSSSQTATLFSVNTEKAVNENVMVQATPEFVKNGNKDAKAGGTLSVIYKEKNTSEKGDLINKYTVTAGRTARKYNAASFLFPDENSVVWAQDNANANRFDKNTYENDRKFVEISGEMGVSTETRARASYSSSKEDGLLYLTDLNSRDARYTFNAFADGAKVSRLKLGLEHDLNESLTADAGVTYTKITDSANDLMPYIPKTQYSLGLNYKNTGGFDARLAQNIKEEMDSSHTPAANLKVPRYSTLDFKLSKSFSDNGKILFKADNLLGSDLNLRPGYSYKGRTFGLGLNYAY